MKHRYSPARQLTNQRLSQQNRLRQWWMMSSNQSKDSIATSNQARPAVAIFHAENTDATLNEPAQLLTPHD
ncbi:hypothetical protein [Beggiatoa leptomitoformis]|uniref:Uncharacterized protein n=1 Tax=Beggiatoa leptomitoformis TaxID=288004 RepID=A0A2N9YGM3_9GAMM|nr:hypothetical protein [Beggiatoa leptomitoformis]ALG68083.1 hypothetical protein AL038_10670 [Beggiatoa leptomitoformis]AUI69623.1 hypothetical protein BLE401_13600 [Beggiatoa leptomitoformis]